MVAVVVKYWRLFGSQRRWWWGGRTTTISSRTTSVDCWAGWAKTTNRVTTYLSDAPVFLSSLFFPSLTHTRLDFPKTKKTDMFVGNKNMKEEKRDDSHRANKSWAIPSTSDACCRFPSAKQGLFSWVRWPSSYAPASFIFWPLTGRLLANDPKQDVRQPMPV